MCANYEVLLHEVCDVTATRSEFITVVDKELNIVESCVQLFNLEMGVGGKGGDGEKKIMIRQLFWK
jgi:hypothetical protein